MKHKIMATEWLKEKFVNGSLQQSDFIKAAEIERELITNSYWDGVNLVGYQTEMVRTTPKQEKNAKDFELIKNAFAGKCVSIHMIRSEEPFNKMSKKRLGMLLKANGIKMYRTGVNKICKYDFDVL